MGDLNALMRGGMGAGAGMSVGIPKVLQKMMEQMMAGQMGQMHIQHGGPGGGMMHMQPGGGGGRPGKRPPAARHWPVARRTLRLRGGGGPLEEPSRSRLGASLQAIFVCTGGGSLIAGVAAIVKQLMPGPSDAVREAAARREGARLTPRHCLEQAPRSSESSRRRTT